MLENGVPVPGGVKLRLWGLNFFLKKICGFNTGGTFAQLDEFDVGMQYGWRFSCTGYRALGC